MVNSNQAPPPMSNSIHIRPDPESSRVRSYGQISAIGLLRDMKDVVMVDLGSFKKGEEIYDSFGVYGARREQIDTEQSAAVHTLIGKNDMMVTCVGGSKAVLSRGGAAVQLLDDYKPDGDISERRSDEGRVPVSTNASESQVRLMERSNADEFLILGSNGLWDVVSNEMACQIARICCRDGGGSVEIGCQAAATFLAHLAVHRGSKDNVGIVVIDLRI